MITSASAIAIPIIGRMSVTADRLRELLLPPEEAAELDAPGNTDPAVLGPPLSDVVRGFEMRRLVRKGVPIKTPTYCVDDTLVWGATARIVQHLLERLEPVL